jgi:cell division protein FtsB
MSQKIEDIREEVKIIEQHGKYLLERSRAIQSAEAYLLEQNDKFKKGLEGWFDAERIHIKSLSGKLFDEQEPVLQSHEGITNTIVALNGVITVKKNAEEELPNYIGLTLSAVLEYELANVESLKELLKVHDEMVKDINSTNNQISKLETSKNVKHEQIQDLKQRLEDKTICLNYFYKGFLYFTIPNIARSRASYSRRFFSGFICSQMSNSYSIFKACQEFFQQLQLPMQAVAEETCRMLDLLKIKPIAKLPYEEIDSHFVGGNHGLTSTSKDGGDSLSPIKSPSSGLSGSKSPIPLKSSNMFMSYDSDGFNGLFERGLAISQKKPLAKKTGETVSTPTTHLFTSSIAPLNAPGNKSASSLGSSGSSSPPPAASSPPPVSNEYQGNSNDPLAGFGGSSSSASSSSSAPPPAAKKSSTLTSNKGSSDTSLPRFVEPGEDDAGSSLMKEDSTRSAGSPLPEIGSGSKPGMNEKSKNILSSLLGDPSSSNERPVSGRVSPTPPAGAAAANQNDRLSAKKNASIWDDA